MPIDTHKDSSGPAFPTPCSSLACDQGLTKREWFAGMALQGLLAGTEARYSQELIVSASFIYADMMLEESKKGK